LEVTFTKRALKERQFWKKSGNRTVQKRISGLLNAILDNPYTGIGKPEALRENLSGYWSRRITQEHRMVYKIDEKKDMLVIVSIRFYY
jgi:toxin YoeB